MPKPNRARGSEARDPFEGVEDEVSTTDAIFTPSRASAPAASAPSPAPAPRAPRTRAEPAGGGGFEVPEIDLRRASEKKRKQASFEWEGNAYAAAQDWLAAHPGHTLTSMLYCGLSALGLPIDKDLLRPRRLPNGLGSRVRRKG